MYGKVFLGKEDIDPDIVHNMSKLLKIKWAMMSQLGLAITYAQMVVMGPDRLIDYLLNLKAHFLAIETCKLLKLNNEVLSRIFTDWAITAIDRDRDNRQVELAERIYERFNQLQKEKDMKINDIALTEIAHEAAKKDKRELAKKLLEKETSITRKIPVLVWMKEYESSLEEAFIGKDSNLINLVLIKFFSFASRDERYSLYKRVLEISPDLVVQLINYLKRTNKKEFLGEFLEAGRASEAVQLEMASSAASPVQKTAGLGDQPSVARLADLPKTADLLRAKQVELKKCKDLAEQTRDLETAKRIDNEIKVLDYCLKDRSICDAPLDRFRVLKPLTSDEIDRRHMSRCTDQRKRR